MKTLLFALLFSFLLPAENAILSGIRSDAAAKKQRIAVYFSGSDWCANCHRFSKEVLSTPDIDQQLKNDFVFYTADFPQRKKLDAQTLAANEQLAEKLNPESRFPVLVITDGDLNVIARIHAGHDKVEVAQKLAEIKKLANGQ